MLTAESRMRMLNQIVATVRRSGFCYMNIDILADLFPVSEHNRDVEFITGVMYALEGKPIPPPAPTVRGQWEKFLRDNHLLTRDIPEKPGMLFVFGTGCAPAFGAANEA